MTKIILTVLILVVVGGCAGLNSGGRSPTQDVVFTATELATQVQTTTPATYLPATEPTQILIPTEVIGNEDARVKWLFEMSFSDGCDLPCWWGLVPGTATLAGAKTLMGPLGYTELETAIAPESYNVYALAIGTDLIERVSLATWSNPRGTIDRITVSFDGLAGQFTGKEMLGNEFSIDRVFEEYGQPTRVLVGLVSTPPEQAVRWEYMLWLLYEDQGFSIYYAGAYDLPRQGDEFITVCPSFDALNSLYLILRPSIEYIGKLNEFRIPQESLIEEHIRDGALLEIETATRFSKEEFVQLFAKGDEACFSTPVSVWE